MKSFRNSGQEVTYNASADKKSGDLVVIGSMVGVLANDVKAGEQSSASVEGVFELKKKASLAINQGDKVYLAADGTVTKTSSDAAMGLATKAAQANDASVLVKLVPGMS